MEVVKTYIGLTADRCYVPIFVVDCGEVDDEKYYADMGGMDGLKWIHSDTAIVMIKRAKGENV